MFVVYCMMHDTVQLQHMSPRSFIGNDSFWTELNQVEFTGYSIGFYLIGTLPSRLYYWVYEVLHVFFVLTVQFAAFFTIAFWLFLLFYTFFVYEKFEHYFVDLRRIRSQMRSQLADYKKGAVWV